MDGISLQEALVAEGLVLNPGKVAQVIPGSVSEFSIEKLLLCSRQDRREWDHFHGVFRMYLCSAFPLEFVQQPTESALILAPRTVILYVHDVLCSVLPKLEGILLLLQVRNDTRPALSSDWILHRYCRTRRSLGLLDRLRYHTLHGNCSKTSGQGRERGTDANPKGKAGVLEEEE